MELLNKDQIKSLTGIITNKIYSDIREHNNEIMNTTEYKKSVDAVKTSNAWLEYELFLANVQSEITETRLSWVKDSIEMAIKDSYNKTIDESFGLINTDILVNHWDLEREVSARLSLTEVGNYDTIVDTMVAIIKNKYQIYA